jgi:putative flippase GtrA
MSQNQNSKLKTVIEEAGKDFKTIRKALEKVIQKYPIIGQFIRFGLIGGLNTSVDLGILNILMFSTGIYEGGPYSVFKTISFCFAAVFGYFMHKTWSFKDTSKDKALVKFSQFFAVSLIGAIINVGVATLVVNYLKPIVNANLTIFISDPLWATIGALCGTAIGLIWNFIGYKLIVFKK